MRPRTMLFLFIPVALSCSGDDPALTANRPGFSVTCPPPPLAITATPSSSTTASPNSSGTATFLVSDGCTDGVDVGLIASRSGAVLTVGTPSPSFVSLNSNQSVTVSVPYTVGPSGTGTVVLGSRPTPSTMSGSLAVTVSQTGAGVPFGPADLFDASRNLRQVSPFTWTMDIVDSAGIIAQINTARTNHIKFALVMTGGGHGNYITNGTFDIAKWKAIQDRFNTSAIKSAVASGVADGTILFAVLMDEPNNSSWGPPGTVTHAIVDQLSQYTKSIFPTLRTGIDVTYTWEPTSVYQSVDVMTTQFAGTQKSGDTTAYRTQAASSAATQKVALFFSINILNGGQRLMSSNCPMPQTGGLGSTENGVLVGCKMTAAEVQAYGDALLKQPEACGLKMWTWDLTTLTPTGDFMTRADNRAAFTHVAGTAAGHAARPCVKPS
jgi:hypothetical protein